MGKYRADLLSFDEDRQVVEFDIGRPKKITGSRIAAIAGLNEYTTEFKVACEIAKLYPGDPPTKYTEAGNVMEPKIRDYVRRNADSFIGKDYGGVVGIKDPVPKEECFYEHFPGKEPFGGMVDGYVTSDGFNAGILEIKTAKTRKGWINEDGTYKVPTNYLLQASLYCELSGLKKITFVVGFPEEDDYDNPDSWEPSESNVLVITVDGFPMKSIMSDAVRWYNKYIKNGVTPPWTEKDKELVDWLLANSSPY